jgi:hypothetical protein
MASPLQQVDGYLGPGEVPTVASTEEKTPTVGPTPSTAATGSRWNSVTRAQHALERVLNTAILGHKAGQVAKAFIFAATVFAAGYHYLTSTGVYRSTREFLVDKNLKLLLGDVKGAMVYESLRNNFSAYKKKMDYRVELSDTPFQDSLVGEPLRTGDYCFFKADLDISRVDSINADEVMIVAITNTDNLADWIKRPNVIFREVIGINPSENAWVDSVMAEIDKTSDISAKVMKVSKIFQVRFYINGLLVSPSDVRREPNAFGLVYKHPKLGDDPDKPVNYTFTYWSVQPRQITAFPFIVSEPTEDLHVRIAYSLAAFKNVHFFPAFVTGVTRGNPKIEFDDRNKVLDIASTRKEWLFPGSGALMYWSR